MTHINRKVKYMLYCGIDDHSEKAEDVRTHANESERMADERFAWTEFTRTSNLPTEYSTLFCSHCISRFLTMTSVCPWQTGFVTMTPV